MFVFTNWSTQYVEMGRPLITARHSVTKPRPAEPMQSDVFVADKATRLEVVPSCRRQDGREETAESHASSADTLKAEGCCAVILQLL